MANTGVWVTVSLIILVLVGGFFLFNSAFNSSDKEEYQGLVVVEKSDSQEDPSSSEETSIEVPETKEFNIIAKQWDFSPSTITVNQGDKVILNVKSIDVAHGLAIREFGINEYLSPGQTTKIEFTANRKGTYSFFCSVSCGVGHTRMSGKIIVN